MLATRRSVCGVGGLRESERNLVPFSFFSPFFLSFHFSFFSRVSSEFTAYLRHRGNCGRCARLFYSCNNFWWFHLHPLWVVPCIRGRCDRWCRSCSTRRRPDSRAICDPSKGGGVCGGRREYNIEFGTKSRSFFRVRMCHLIFVIQLHLTQTYHIDQ